MTKLDRPPRWIDAFAYIGNRQVKQTIKTDSRICLGQDRQIKQVMDEIEKAESSINQKEVIK